MTKGKGAGLYGHSGSSSITSYGVYGFSPGGAGVYGFDSNAGDGVLGASSRGNGIHGETSSPSEQGLSFQNAGVLGEDRSSDGGQFDAGVAGTSQNGYGVYGSTTYGFGVTGIAGPTEGVGVYGNSPKATAVFGETTTGLSFAAANQTAFTMSLDASGNMILLGNLTVDGTITSPSSTTPAISSQDRDTQIERVGGGNLATGSAYVTIDSDFAKRLDPTKTYRVFITPDGDSNELYVTGKTSTGFTVRESHHGTSTVAFDYRIVGTPRRVAIQRPFGVGIPASKLRNLQAMQR